MWLALGREVTSPWISVKRAGATVPQTERKWHNLGTRWGRHGSVFYLQTELDGSRPPSGCNGAESTGKRSTATRAGPPISHPAVVPWVEFCSSLIACHSPLLLTPAVPRARGFPRSPCPRESGNSNGEWG